MALLPYRLRPKIIVRQTAIRRGAERDSVVWKALSIYYVRGPKVMRNQAIVRALSGNRKWQALGMLAFLTQDVRGAFTRQPEVISEERLRPGQHVSVSATKPLSRKEQKRTGITRKVLERQALADVAAAAKAADSTS